MRVAVAVVAAVAVAVSVLALGTIGEQPFYAGVLAAVGLAVIGAVNRPAWRPAMYGVLAGVAGAFGVLIYGVSQFG